MTGFPARTSEQRGAEMGGLAKRIRREIKKHPAKATLLGILCVVALALWGPKMLARRSTAGNGGALATSASLLPITSSATSQIIQISQTSQNVKSEAVLESDGKWRELVKWQSTHRSELAIPADLRDPFAAVVMVNSGAWEKAQETADGLAAAVRSMIRCTGVVITPKRRWVILDSKYVEEGSEFTLRHGGTECRVQVVRVYDDRVVFRVNGNTFEYNIARLGIIPDRSQL